MGMIEAWVTALDGTYLAHLERSEASPFRRFSISTELNGPGAGSLDYHLENAIVAEHDDLFAWGNLVWFRYRDKTRVWIVEERGESLDEGEHESDWIKVAGRGVMQLLGDRTVWPTHYDDDHANPAVWGLGGWATKTDASAAIAQKVVPVTSTTAGDGATVGDPVEIVGGGHRQIGIIAAIVAGVSIELEDPLAFTFPTGSRIRAAATQWRRFVNRRAGEMLWDLINESNPRFATQLVRGVVESTGVDGWTQDLRFDNLLDVVQAVTRQHGDVEMDGLTFNYRIATGVDRTDSVVLEEGKDLLALDVEDNDRDSLSWIVAEGTGHANYAFLAPKKKLTRSQRKTAARNRRLHRKAPPAPRKVIHVKAEYDLDLAVEAVGIARRREAFLDAKDVGNLVQLDELADAALEEHGVAEAVGLKVDETRYRADLDYGLGDWIRAIAPSRGFDEDVRVVAITFAEDDEDEQVHVDIDVNSRRQEALLAAKKPGDQARSSIGVANRQPQGQLVPFSFGGADVFDDTDTMDVFLFVPDRMYVTIESKALLRFREFFASAKTAASGGGSSVTSGSSSTSTSGGGGGHEHSFATDGGLSAPGGAGRVFSPTGVTGGLLYINAGSAGALVTGPAINPHEHTISHTHGVTVAAHTHALTYGVFKETYPGSHSVTLKVYELEAGAWVLRATVPTLTSDIEEVDLTAYITGPGNWRLELKSDAAQPNGGRLGCDVSGYVLGAIQSS